MKSYREQCRSLHFLSFIKKKKRKREGVIPGSWASLLCIFSKQMPQKDTERERIIGINTQERKEEKERGGDKERGEGGKSKQAKIKDWVGFLLAQECRCLQPAVYAGRGTELCQTEQT